MCWRCFSPFRVVKSFYLLISILIIVRHKQHFLGIRPLPPDRLKNSIVELGASFIKLAQVLATRADFFPESYLKYLRELHDEIPPMNSEQFNAVFQTAFPEKVFQQFDEVPIASASIGQVHKAVLPDDTVVAVKIRRYQIKEIVKADIVILKGFNFLFRPFFNSYTQHSLDSLIAEFSRMILEEVNFTIELQNLIRFRSMYHTFDVKMPEPYPNFCSEDALVMSFEEGARFDDKEKLAQYDVDFTAIMEKLIHFYTEQMLINGFFHADPHPGNLLINANGDLILLDFGMVHQISDETRQALIEVVKSANERNYQQLIMASKRLGTISHEAPTGELQMFAEKVFHIFDNEHLSAISMQTIVFEVMQSLKTLPFKLPQEAIYIMRASSIIEGLGTTYIENFNGIKDILPLLKKNIPRALGAENMLDLIWAEFETLPLKLKKISDIIEHAHSGEMKVRLAESSVKEIERMLHQLIKRWVFRIGVAVLVIVSFWKFIS